MTKQSKTMAAQEKQSEAKFELSTEESCSYCGQDNELTADSVSYQHPERASGTLYYVTSYVCERCGKKNVVLVDDYWSKRKLEELKSCIRRKAKGESVQSERVNKVRLDLHEARERALASYLKAGDENEERSQP